MTAGVLTVEGLCVEAGGALVTEDVSFRLEAGEMLGLVGESGCGKTITALSIMRLLQAPAVRIRAGRIVFEGEDLTAMEEAALGRVRGRRIGMIFQEPMTSLNPVFTIGAQIAEPLIVHEGATRQAARARAAALLDLVGIPAAARQLDRFPHQLSGGQRQRVMIAIALACHPRLLIADEPTTALDVTVQAQNPGPDRPVAPRARHGLPVDHPRSGRGRRGLRPRGRDVRGSHRRAGPGRGPVRSAAPSLHARVDRHHPRAQSAGQRAARDRRRRAATRHARERLRLRRALRGAGARMRERTAGIGWRGRAPPCVLESRMSALLEVRGLSKDYAGAGRPVRAVDDVSFELAPGESLGIVGESGCGKTTLGRMLARLIEPTRGAIVLDGQDITRLSGSKLKRARRDIQMVFQDPFGSLNPRHGVGRIVAEPLVVHGLGDRERRVTTLLAMVGLPADSPTRYPHEFSGGQRQRIAIARALALSPRLLIADEPVSALDVSIQSQIINLIAELRRSLGLTLVFISHDLSVVRHVCDRIAVMYFGRLVEIGPAAQVFDAPAHPYTRALLSSVPRVPGGHARERIVLEGELPDPQDPPAGCAFHTRCPHAFARCRVAAPSLAPRGNGALSACHLE
jgi:peptide/nickel transport system ATP-binding protein